MAREKTAFNQTKGAAFQEARERAGLSQEQAAEKLFCSAGKISSIEHGCFTTHKRGEIRADLPALVRDMAKLYNAPELEDYFCANLCPLGENREQLKYKDVNRIAEDLSGSITLISSYAWTVVDMVQKDSVSEDEWPRWQKILAVLQQLSYHAKSMGLWAKTERYADTEKESGKDILTAKENPYKQARAEHFGQEEAAQKTGINRSKLSAIEQADKKRELPTPKDVISMSKAYLSPKIKNFYCYHDCEIGGRMEPLNIYSLDKVALALVCSLFYIRDRNDTLKKLLEDEKISESEQAEFRDTLADLKRLSNSADAMVLWMQDNLCRKLWEILSDGKVTKEEWPTFKKTLDFLGQLGFTAEELDELRSLYVKER